MFCPPRAAIGAAGQPHTRLALKAAQRTHRERERMERLFESMGFTQLEMFDASL
jgi:hypothetical protein